MRNEGKDAFEDFFPSFFFTCALLQTLEQIPTSHNTFTGSLLGVLELDGFQQHLLFCWSHPLCQQL